MDIPLDLEVILSMALAVFVPETFPRKYKAVHITVTCGVVGVSAWPKSGDNTVLTAVFHPSVISRDWHRQYLAMMF